MKKFFYIFSIFLVILLASWIGWGFYKAYQPKKLVLQGEIDAQTYNIASKLPGRISKVYVKKGDKVEVGDKIFSIYSPEVEAKLKQATAARDAAKAKKEEAYNGARKEQVKAAIEQYKKAKVAEKLMEKTYKRIEKLYKEGVISQQKKDEVFTKYQAAKYTSNAAYEMMKMAKEGARIELKKAASAQEKVYEAKIDEVESFAKDSDIYAFKDGEVTAVLIHQGELTPAGFPVVMIIDMKDTWARFSVREDLLHFFKIGNVLHVKIPALGEKLYQFKVSYISPQGEYAVWKAAQGGKGFDMKSFEVELRPIKPIGNLRVGMSVLVEL